MTRILLKLSGNFFSGEKDGLDFDAIGNIADEIMPLHKKGIQIALVNGAGNIFRGREKPQNFDSVAAHKIGMIATLPNALALTEILNSRGVDTRIMCSFEIPGLCRQFDTFRARALLKEKKIIIIAGGTGNPFFSTDTNAVLRALELKVDLLLKATDVDGVYTEDPKIHPDAKKYKTLTYKEALAKQLQIIDQAAFALAYENSLSMLIFKFGKGSLVEVLKDPSLGTIVSP